MTPRHPRTRRPSGAKNQPVALRAPARDDRRVWRSTYQSSNINTNNNRRQVAPLQARRIPADVATPTRLWRLQCGTGGRTPAGGVQAEKQQRYVQLIAQGVSNSEACRLVGINRKTGNRWRYGRRVRNSAGALVIYAPVKITESRPRSPRYLSEQERIQIADLLAARMRVRGIAGSWGVRRRRSAARSGATATRTGATVPITPSRPLGCGRASRASGGSLCDGVLAEVVQRLLAKRWSPEQVAHELRVLFAGQPSRWLCKESIYQAIYDTAVSFTRPARRRRRRRRLSGSAAPRDG